VTEHQCDRGERPVTWLVMGYGTASFLTAGAAHLLTSPVLAGLALLLFLVGAYFAGREVVRAWIRAFSRR
jgi:hypothetical protein